MSSKPAYSTEDTQRLLSLYKTHGTENLELIAEELNKPIKSVRSKLVREKVYVAQETGYVKKTGKSKKELLRELETIMGEDAQGLSGATKESLNSLLDFLKKEEL